MKRSTRRVLFSLCALLTPSARLWATVPLKALPENVISVPGVGLVKIQVQMGALTVMPGSGALTVRVVPPHPLDYMQRLGAAAQPPPMHTIIVEIADNAPMIDSRESSAGIPYAQRPADAADPVEQTAAPRFPRVRRAIQAIATRLQSRAP